MIATVSSATWKCLLSAYALLALCVLTAVFSPRLSFDENQVGGFGAQLRAEPVFGSQRFIIDALTPASPLAKEGAKTGNLILFDHYFDFGGSLRPGELIGLSLIDGPSARHLQVATIVATWPLRQGLAILTLVYCAAAITISLLIGFKQATDPAARALSVFFMTLALNLLRGIAVPGTSYVAANDAWSLTICIYWASLIFFATSYQPDSISARRQAMRRGLPACLLVAALGTLSYGWSMDRNIPGGPAIGGVWVHTATAIVLFALWDGWRSAHGASRQRQLWIFCLFGTLALLTAPPWVTYYGLPQYYMAAHILLRIGSLLVFGGLAYAILRHRVLNLGFAINRALVVTLISTLLLMIFAVTEWAVDKLLHFEGREKNVIFDAAVALAIILSFHRIQHWISHQVDHLFFHHWHEAAEALRLFLAQAVHISSSAVLQSKAIHAFTFYAAATGAAIYLRNGEHDFERANSTLPDAPDTVDANNDAVVAMQHSRNAVDLHHCADDLPGELALPLLVRGKLNGIVLMGFKQNGQHYRPDEVNLLANGAHQIGLDLESLRVSELEHRLRASDIAAEEARRSASMTEQKLIATEKQAELLEQKSCAQEREAIALRCLLKAETQ